MESILNYLKDFTVLNVFLRLIAASLMGGLIGLERGRHGRAAGLRTHILVCVGAAITSLTSMYLSETLGYTSDVARLSAQVISGIGFLGAGMILIRNNSVITGLTTAAGMWATAAIGVAIGYGFYSAAIISTLICILSVTTLSRLERKRKNIFNVYMEISDVNFTETAVEAMNDLGEALITYDVIPPKSGCAGNVGLLFSLSGHKNFKLLKESLGDNPVVVMLLCDING